MRAISTVKRKKPMLRPELSRKEIMNAMRDPKKVDALARKFASLFYKEVPHEV